MWTSNSLRKLGAVVPACGLALVLVTAALLTACAVPQVVQGRSATSLALLQGWYEGETVFYVTTDVSDADVARDKSANFAPRLAQALPAVGTAAEPGRAPVDKVYAITNFTQSSVFASAPRPLGHLNRETAYSPLWQMVKVTWSAAAVARTLKSEEEVLDAEQKGQVVLRARIHRRARLLRKGRLTLLPDHGPTLDA